MIPDNVTLVVKAPNQQIEDQNVECESSWTVRQLKGHLSNVYPSKPRTEEQKLIYSGQLLNDECVLKDVLRCYDADIPHTMHLVCSAPIQAAPVPRALNDEGLRQRMSTASNRTTSSTTAATERPETNRPETRQNDQNHTVEMQNYLSSMGYNSGPGYLAAAAEPNMLAMHHAYLHYMQRYAHQWQEAVAAAPAPPPPQAPPAAPPAEEEERRDWLDHLYAASRLAVLFSLVYLYGSPARLLLVVLLAAAGYLHQIGFFRDLQVNPQEPLRQRPNVQNANAVNANGNIANANINNANANLNNANIINANANINNANANINRANGENSSENMNNANVAAEQAINDNQQSILAVTWMIFTSFFASLIPDTNQ